MDEIPPKPPIPPDPPDPLDDSRKRKSNEEPSLAPKKFSPESASGESASHGETSVSQAPAIMYKDYYYSRMSEGPFIVFVRYADTTTKSPLLPIKLGKFLFGRNVQGVVNGSIKSEGKFKVSVAFSSPTFANSFLKNIFILSNSIYKAFVPSFLSRRMGIIRGVDEDLSEEEIKGALSAGNGNFEIVKVRRLQYKDRQSDTISWKPSRSIVITFAGQSLPSQVYMFYSSFRVEVYVLPTLQCFKCCKFGHTKAKCLSVEKCYNCGKQHASKECESEVKCFNCGGDHKAISQSCPEYRRQKSIKESMATANCSYIQAAKIHPQKRALFSEVTSGSTSAKYEKKSKKAFPQQPKPFNKKEYNSLLMFPNGNCSYPPPDGCAIPSNPIDKDHSYSKNPKNSKNPIQSLRNVLNKDNQSYLNSLITILIDTLTSQKPVNAESLISSLQSFITNNG
jgi:hypothetical protein